jgi:hypothetical protein
MSKQDEELHVSIFRLADILADEEIPPDLLSDFSLHQSPGKDIGKVMLGKFEQIFSFCDFYVIQIL